MPRASSKGYRQKFSRGDWGWDARQRMWRPASYAGRKVKVGLFDAYTPLKCLSSAFSTWWRILNLVASRRGGKTYNAARIFLRRISVDVSRVRKDLDEFVRVSEWNRWFQNAAGTPAVAFWLGEDVIDQLKAPLHYWVIAPTYTLTRIMRREIMEILTPWRDELGVIMFGSTLYVLAWGVRIDFRSGHDPAKLVGEGLRGIWVGEAARLKEYLWDHIGPTLEDKKGWVITDTTPLGRNWYYHTFWCQGDRDAATMAGIDEFWADDVLNLHWTLLDNTALPHLREKFYRAIRQWGIGSKFVIDNYLASFDQPFGRIFPMWNERVHVVQRSMAEMEHCIGGMDFGYTGSSGCGLVAFADAKGRVHVYSGLHAKGRLVASTGRRQSRRTWAGYFLAERGKAQRKWCAAHVAHGGIEPSLASFGMPIMCDPSRPDSIDNLVDVGLDARPANNAVLDGIERVSAMLAVNETTGTPWLTFDPDVPRSIIMEMAGYEWATDKSGVSLGRPKKVDDHGPDTARYLVSGLTDLAVAAVADYDFFESIGV